MQPDSSLGIDVMQVVIYRCAVCETCTRVLVRERKNAGIFAAACGIKGKIEVRSVVFIEISKTREEIGSSGT